MHADLGPLDRSAYRLFCTDGRTMTASALASEPGAFAIVGRHLRCDVVLAEDDRVSLRHLLLRVIRTVRGEVALRIFDLGTNLGFWLPNGGVLRVAVCTGAVAFRVGPYALVATPGNACAPPELPQSVVGVAPEGPSGSPYRVASVPRSSVIMTYPPPTHIEARTSQPFTSGAHKGLVVQLGPRRELLQFDEAELERGVFVGRAERCESRIREWMNLSVSRLHTLVIREGEDVVGYDLCSTNGLYGPRGTRVRVGRLCEGVRLGQGPILRWQEGRS
jgi:hypothetical protein